MRDQFAYDEDRRRFIRQLSIFVAGLSTFPFTALSLSGCSSASSISNQSSRMSTMPTRGGRMPCGSCDAPANLSWKTVIASKDETGEPLLMSGTIYQPDGTTPAEGLVLFVFHTDAKGHYNKEDDPNNPRLRGWMKTGKDGRYEFRTIKPAPYPQLTTPAHIHAHIYGQGYPEYYIDEYWFEGDPLITPAERAKLSGRGGFPSIITLTRDGEGVLRGVRNIKLEHIQN
jgi:protocatechuate 3,4-dioxygenase beta subunit